MSDKEFDGKYMSDVFLIEFPEHIKVFHKSNISQGPKTQKEYSIFIHEYWHFLLNISTVVRFRDFSIWHHLIPVFSRALSKSEEFDNISEAISDNDKKILEETWDLMMTYNNDGFEGIQGKDYQDYKITGSAIYEPCDLSLFDKPIKFQKVKYPVEVQTEKGIEKGFLNIGNNAIDESIANSVETIINPGKAPSPLFLYQTLIKLSEFYNNGKRLTNYELASIGTLSFLTTNPSASLENLFNDFISIKEKSNTDQAFKVICDKIKPDFMQVASVLLHDLQNIQEVYKGREPMEQAINYIAKKIKMAIHFRLSDLLFDLKPFVGSKLNQELLNHLTFKLIIPCDVKQAFNGPDDEINRDIIKSFDLNSIKLGESYAYPSYLMQVLNCQMNYFRAHWALFTLVDSKNATSLCPYYTTCDLPDRTKNMEYCKTKPWKNYNQNKENCMYGTAISTLKGLVKLK